LTFIAFLHHQFTLSRPKILLHIWDFSSIFIAQHAEITPTHIRSVKIVRDASYRKKARREGKEQHAEKGEGILPVATELNINNTFP
jgi:hypothetical protein